MIEDMCHRNMAFTLYHAYHLPQVAIDSAWVQELPGGLRQVDVIVKNERVVPPHSSQDVKNKITRPDYVRISGPDVQVVAAFLVDNPLLNLAREQKHHPERIAVDNIPGMGAVQVRWLVSGKTPFTITLDSVKGGKAQATIP